MHYDPTGHVMKEDKDLSASAQTKIIGYTNAYYDAQARGDKKRMEDAHKQAEAIRKDPKNQATPTGAYPGQASH